MKQATRKKRIYLKLIAVGLFSVLAFLIAYHLFYHPQQVDGGFATIKYVINDHRNEIWAAKYHPGGSAFVSASVDSTARIYRAADGKLLKLLQHPSGLTNVAVNNAGTLIATTSYDGKVRIWNYTDGKLMFEMSGHKSTPRSVDFSPTKNILASGDDKGIIIYWDAELGKQIKSVAAHDRTVWDVKFSPDGASLISGSFDYKIKVWNMLTGNLIKSLGAHDETVVALAFSRDGKMLASTSDDKTIKIWNTANWSVVKTLEQPEHPQAVSFSPDGNRLITGGRDKPTPGEFTQMFFGDSKFNPGVSMRLWDVTSGKILQTFRDNANDVNDVVFSPDGGSFISASSDRSIKFYSLIKR